MPRVQEVQAGDTILLTFGQDGDYEARLLLRVEVPPGDPVGKTKAMVVLPNINQLWDRLGMAGYSKDLTVREFTGFRVTASTDLLVRGKPPKVRRPGGLNTLRSWKDVLDVNRDDGGDSASGGLGVV